MDKEGWQSRIHMQMALWSSTSHVLLGGHGEFGRAVHGFKHFPSIHARLDAQSESREHSLSEGAHVNSPNSLTIKPDLHTQTGL